MNRNTNVLSVSLPPEIYQEIQKLSKAQRKSKSQLIRDMLNEYRINNFRKQWAKVRKMGEEIRKEYKFKNEDELLEYIHGD